MKKRIMSVLVLAALLSGMTFMPEAQAQIYISEDDYNSNRGTIEEGSLPFIPQLGQTIDQYAPMGGGTFVLGLLASAYLLGKRKKNHE